MNNKPLLYIRYRGIMTFRGLRLIALIFLTLSQMAAVIIPTHKLYLAYQLPSLWDDLTFRFFEIMANMGQASFAMIMVSSLGLVLSRQMSFRKQLIEYFVLAVLTYLATVFIVSETILDMLHGLPSQIGVIEQLLSQLNIVDVIKGLLNRTIQLVIPGNGTVNIEALNNVVGAFGVTSNLPNIEKLTNLVPESFIDRDMLNTIIASFASQDLTQYTGEFVDGLVKLAQSLSPEILAFIDSTLIPRLDSILCSMMNFNVFWNMFLYTLFYFFIVHKPKTLSPGRRMLFHCCAIIPGGWMVISYLVSSQIHLISTFTLPVWAVALLSNAKPSVVTLFFLLVLFEKYNELEFTANRKYQGMTIANYFRSNVASLQFSVGTSTLIIFISAADWLLGMIPGLALWGFGQATKMWACIPFILLYSFNKRPKFKVFNGVISLYYIAHYLWIALFTIGSIALAAGMLSGMTTLSSVLQ